MSGLLDRAGDAQRRYENLLREILVCLLQLDIQSALTQDAADKADHQFPVAGFPILYPFAAHIGDDEVVQRRQFERVDAGFLDDERQGVRHQQARFLEPRGHAAGDVHERLNASQVHAQRNRAAVEPIGGQRPGGGIDLAQTGQRFGFRDGVLGGNSPGAGLTIDALRLRQVELSGQRRGFDGLFGEELEAVGFFNRLDQLDCENLNL